MSNNLNKGYNIYNLLWEHYRNSKNELQFTFIGNNVPKMFSKVPTQGPFKNPKLGQELNKHHLYITASIYDACPNHVLEAISCGLPILYLDQIGGARELCQMFPWKIGEGFSSFRELLIKIKMIQDNYQFYRDNLDLAREEINIKKCALEYYQSMLRVMSTSHRCLDLSTHEDENLIVKFTSSTNQGQIILNQNQSFRILKGTSMFMINKLHIQKIELLDFSEDIQIYNFGNHKLDNNQINILLTSDSNYWVGLLAALNSVVSNTKCLHLAHFNFIIPIENNIKKFSNLLLEFESKHHITLQKTIIYLDEHIINPVFKESKCFNGGGHLLNIGNLSRLLIGEFMRYQKLIYLDSDSIVQYDIINKLAQFQLRKKMYAPYANNHHPNKKKEIVIKMSQLLMDKFDWKKISGHELNLNDYAYLGAPFITNCRYWSEIYQKTINLVKIHNTTKQGLFKLFTMSLQNILFYGQMGNINEVLNVIQDLGSARKQWDREDLVEKDVLDWSGVYKPWYSNGLYQHLWKPYDLMELSIHYGPTQNNKNVVEKFKK
jgi:lipopolysaccharide biosynthesis glycosyltransferase